MVYEVFNDRDRVSYANAFPRLLIGTGRAENARGRAASVLKGYECSSPAHGERPGEEYF